MPNHLRTVAVLTAFLADSGVPTRGLPWTTGKLKLAGIGTTPLVVTVEVEGIVSGIARSGVYFSQGDWPGEAAEKALITDGLKLSALKCGREKEGASYGNVVYVVKAAGKTASALWVSWDCGQSGCGGGFAILYHRADVTPIECAGA